MLRFWSLALLILWLAIPAQAAHPLGKHLTRVFYQDSETQTVKWADLLQGSTLNLALPEAITGFPQLDPGRQSLGQMQIAGGWLLVTVRDKEDGKFQSGWVLIDCGIETRPHGNHLDWVYARPPRVRATQLDANQGNPPHIWLYDDVFYVTQDKRGGFTRLAPKELTAVDTEDSIRRKAAFHAGGGGHISLAVAGQTGFASWIDREGDNAGRVDVTAISTIGAAAPAQMPKLGAGGIHGATVAAQKAFFASASGVHWIDTRQIKLHDAASITPQLIELGKIGDQPRHTGHFSKLGNRVGFVSGTGADAELGILDADPTPPVLTKLSIPVAEGHEPGGLELIKPRRGNPIALFFQEQPGDSKSQLTLIKLDPNGDQKWDDLRVGLSYPVGPARIEGHAGHHAIGVDSDQFRCVLTNPGDGTLSVFSLDQRKLLMNYTVGGSPTRIAVYGGHVH